MKNTNTTYSKSHAQLRLESILLKLEEKDLLISQLKKDSNLKTLDSEFQNALAEIIYVLVHEKNTSELISYLAKSYTSMYYSETKDFDMAFEIASETYIGLYSIITKKTKVTDKKTGVVRVIDNRGKLRLDTLQKKGAYNFVRVLRKYIQHNICMDVFADRLGLDAQMLESIYAYFDNDTDEVDKTNTIAFNKNGIENSPNIANNVIESLSHDTDLRIKLVNALIYRFRKKLHAAYIFLCIMNESYNPTEVVRNLKTKNFNWLFHDILKDLAENEDDFKEYENTTFASDSYIESLRNTDDCIAKDRIYRLANQTYHDVMKLDIFQDAQLKYRSICK